MTRPDDDRRSWWAVLFVILVILGGAAYVTIGVYQSTLEPSEERGRSVATVEDDSEPADGGWRHHDWRADAGPLGSVPLGDSEHAPSEDGFDPQWQAMRRTLGIVTDAGASLPFAPRERDARLVELEGTVRGVSTGARCAVRVLPVSVGSFNCLVRVSCGGEVLYPNPSQTGGYVPCELEDGRPVRVNDLGHTALDGDPRLTLDLNAGTATVEDLGDRVTPFRARLRLE